jgi:hypothetical protein
VVSIIGQEKAQHLKCNKTQHQLAFFGGYFHCVPSPASPMSMMIQLKVLACYSHKLHPSLQGIGHGNLSKLRFVETVFSLSRTLSFVFFLWTGRLLTDGFTALEIDFIMKIP